MARKRRSRRTVKTVARMRKCRSVKIKCAGKLYRCHPGRKHRKGMFCKLIGKARKAKKYAMSYVDDGAGSPRCNAGTPLPAARHRRPPGLPPGGLHFS